MKSLYCNIIFVLFSFQIVAQNVTDGKLLFEQGKYTEALQTLELVIKSMPNDSLALFYSGRSLLALNKYEEAIEQFKILTRLYPDHADFNYWCGVAYRYKLTSTNNFLEKSILASKTKQYYEKAVQLDPKHKDAKIALANYYINAPAIAGGSKNKALKLAEELESLDIKSAHELRISIYQSNQEYDLVISEYNKLLSVLNDNEKPDIYYNLGFMYQANKQYDEAFAAFTQAIQVNEKLYKAYYQYARTAIFSQQNIDQAIHYMQFYLQNAENLSANDVKPSDAWWRLGMLYELKGDIITAKNSFEKALELNPNNENARKSLQALK